MISVALPSRGLIFAECEMALDKALSGYHHKIHRSFNLEIPECQNVLVDEALQDGSDYILFIEEDMVIPEDAVHNLVQVDGDIAALDYGVAGYSCITRDRNTNEILWCGLGCTLVKREVFTQLEKPYFRSDKLLLLNDWPDITWVNAGNQGYGGQDIYFCIKAREKGFKIKQIKGEARHLKLEALGRAEINKGLHQIIEKPKIMKHQTL